ncbi:AAA family ATPase [Methanococcus voltae]|uniref:DNA double-strand break repair Rad50 ATPase n=1 Tax=Methanococcus voltae TaxID=2188 RepID=A0A8J7UTD8_METVO|nr:SMC family ATPase [Methanococcus voltae]MBP2172514.1 exonuclease SbcC [Methanococcus voltae]MBP2201579.1 exonuclease SbcC [Methanococcus voltae]
MILKSLELQNFRSHRNSKIEFKEGITTIVGKNGSGKSSIFQAINYALFAPSGKDYSLQNMIKNEADSFRISFTFEVRGKTYTVIRQRNRKSTKSENILFLKDNLNDNILADNNSNVNAKVQEILEMDNNVFANAIYIKQGDIVNLVNLAPKTRKDTIDKILGVEKYAKAHEKMKEIINRYDEKIKVLTNNLTDEEVIYESISKNNELIQNYNNLKSENANNLKNLKSNEKDVLDKLDILKANSEKNEEYNLNLLTNNREIDNLNNNVSNLSDDKSILIDNKTKIFEKKENYKKCMVLMQKMDLLNEKLYNKDNKEFYNKYKELKSNLSYLIKSYGDYMCDNIVKKDNTIIDVQKSTELLNISSNEILIAENINKMGEIAKNTKSIKNFDKSLDIISNDLEVIITELDAIATQKSNMEENKGYYIQYEQLSNKLDDLNEKINVSTILSGRISDIQKEIKNLENTLKEHAKQTIKIKEIEKKLTNLENVEQDIKLNNEKLNSLKSNKINLETKINELITSNNELKSISDKKVCPTCRTELSDEKKNEIISNNEKLIEDYKEALNKCINNIGNISNDLKVATVILNELNNLKTQLVLLNSKKESELNLKLELDEKINNLQNLQNENRLNGKLDDLKALKAELTSKQQYIKDGYTKYVYAENYLKNNNMGNAKTSELDDKKNEIIQKFLEILEKSNKLSLINFTLDSELINTNTLKSFKVELGNSLDTLKDKMKYLQGLNKLLCDITDILKEIASKDLKTKYYEYENNLSDKNSLELELKIYNPDYELYKNSEAVINTYISNYGSKNSKYYEYFENSDLEQLLNNNNEIDVKIAKFEELINKLLNLTNESIRKIETKNNEIISKINALNYSKEEHELFRGKNEALKQQIYDINLEIQKIHSEIVNLENENKHFKQKLEDNNQKKDELNKLKYFKNYLTKVRKVFSRDGVQKHIREMYIPLIQKHANAIFSEFGMPYSHIQITPDCDLIVDEIPVSNMSGGEQVAVALALRLGIANAICDNMECIILDEPTAYLDEDRRRNLLTIFSSIKKINQIVIITHHHEMEEIANEVIRLTKKGDDSKITISEAN